jgi:hypothetical protein
VLPKPPRPLTSRRKRSDGGRAHRAPPVSAHCARSVILSFNSPRSRCIHSVMMRSPSHQSSGSLGDFRGPTGHPPAIAVTTCGVTSC